MNDFKETHESNEPKIEKPGEVYYPNLPESKKPSIPEREKTDDGPFRPDANIFDDILKKTGLISETSNSESNDTVDSSENEKDYSKYLEKGDDGKYCDKETGKSYDSVDQWEKSQETLAKRYEGTAEYYDEKAKKEWAKYKEDEKAAEENGDTDFNKYANPHYRNSQEYYDKAKECKEKAAQIREKLGQEETTPRTPENNGEWEGERGNSTWHPDPEYTPPEKSRNPERPYSNPDNLTWEEILNKYGIEGIMFKDGYPVFDEVARGTVEIDDFSDDRDSNFSQANEKLAEQKGCTPEEVEDWMKENNYTWHECQDCKTMQKVPNEIHANVPHDGGVSVYKSEKTN